MNINEKFVNEISFLNNADENGCDLIDPKELDKGIDIWNKFFNILVPESGPAKTIAGEIIRAYNRVIYRAINDGDIVGNFQDDGSVESALTYVYNTIEQYTSRGDARSLALLEESYQDYLDMFEHTRIKTNHDLHIFRQNFFRGHIRMLKTTAIGILAFLVRDENQFLFDEEANPRNNDNYEGFLDVRQSEIERTLTKEFELDKDDIEDRIEKYYLIINRL